MELPRLYVNMLNEKLNERTGNSKKNCKNPTIGSICFFARMDFLTYLLRVTDWEENQIQDILESLEKAIQSWFIQHSQGNLLQENIHESC